MTAAATLAAGISTLDIAISAASQKTMVAYLDLLGKWNRTYNLTAITDPTEMVISHLLDSLAVLPWLPETDRLRLLDVGAGAGLPGLILAIARPEWAVVLLESRQKKAAFLRQASIELGVRNVEVAAMRVEDYRPAAAFDVVISRAFASLSKFVEVAWPLMRPHSWLVALKGKYPRDELAALTKHPAPRAERLQVPGLAAERHVILVEKSE